MKNKDRFITASHLASVFFKGFMCYCGCCYFAASLLLLVGFQIDSSGISKSSENIKLSLISI